MSQTNNIIMSQYNPEFQRKHLIQKQYFFNQRLPNQIGENFLEERKYFWNEITDKIQHADVVNEALGSNIKLQIVRFNSQYGIKEDEMEYLLSSLLQIVFVRNDIRTESRVILLRLVNDLISLLNHKKLPNLQLDFQVFYEFMEHYYLTNESRAIYSEAGLYSQLTELTYFVKRANIYFTNDSVFKVYDIFKQKLNPLEGQIGFQILALFLKTDVQQSLGEENQDEFNEKYIPFYQTLVDQVIEYMTYRYSDRDNLPLYILKNLAKNIPQLDWAKHYEQLFQIFLKQMNNLLRSDTEENDRDNKILDTLMPDQISGVKNILKIIPDMIVALMPPSDNKNFDLFWSKTERIFNLIDSLLSPSKDGQDWVGDIFKFFKYITKAFLRKYKNDEKLQQKLLNQKLHQHEKEELDSDYSDEEAYEYSNEDYFKFDKNQQNKQQNGHESNGIAQSKKQKKISKEFLLDVKCRDLMLEKLLGYVKKIVFMEDQGYALAKMFFQIANFCPEKILMQFVSQLFQIINQQDEDISLVTVKNILLFLVQPIVENHQRSFLNGGMVQLIRWLKESFKYFQNQGVVENLDMIEIYSKILLYLPINTYEEVLEDYEKTYPGKGESDFIAEYNVSQVNYIQALKDVEEWNSEFFLLLVRNLEHLEFKDLEENTLLVDLQNIFWQYFQQQSPKNRKWQIKNLFERLEDQIFQKSLNALVYMLNCFSYSEPEYLMNLSMQLIFTKIVRKRTNQKEIEDFKKHPLYFILDTSPLKSKILEYEIAISNTESIIYYLTLLENAMAYSNKYIINHSEQLEILIHLGLFQEENVVFEKACDLINTVIISLVTIYPQNLYYLSKNQSQNPQKRIFYLKNIPKLNLEDYEVDWYSPGQEERQFIQQWSNKFMFKCLERFENQYFNQPGFEVFDYANNHEQLVDLLILHKVEENPHKKEFFYLMFVILAGYASLNNRVPFIQNSENEPEIPVYQKFTKTFLLEEYTRLRERLANFLLKAPSVFIQKGVFHEGQILEVFYYISREVFGESYISEEVPRIRDQVQGIKGLNILKRANQFDSRFYFMAEHMAYFYEKIDNFFVFHPNSWKNSQQLYHLFFVLSFSTTYPFKFFLRFNSFKNQEHDKIYHQLHTDLIKILIQKLDPQYQQSYTYKLKNSGENGKSELEKALCHMILQLKRLEKLESFACCASDINTLKSFCKILTFYGGLEEKLYKKTFINIFYKSMFIHYEDSLIINNLNQRELQTPILQSSQMYQNMHPKQNIHSLTMEQCIKLREEYLILIDQISDNILDQNIHWKPRVIFGLFSAYFLNILDNLTGYPQVDKLLDAFFQISIAEDNIHLCQLGRAGIYRIVNLNKRINSRQIIQNHIYTNNMEEEKEDQTRSLDEFLKWHFIEKKDFNSVLKKRFQGFLEGYLPIQKDKTYLLDFNSNFGQTFQKYFTNPEYCAKFFNQILLDKDIAIIEQEQDLNFDPNQTQNMDITTTEGTFFQSLQISFAFTFDRDKKKSNCLFVTSHTLQLYDIYMKFQKKIFQAMGDQYFRTTNEYFTNLNVETNEQMRLQSFYICAIMKWIQKISPEEQQPYIDYCVNIGKNLVENTSQELFKDLLSSLLYACRKNDIRITEKFMEPLLEKTATMKAPGKRLRYYQILKYFIAMNGTKTRKWAIKSIQLIQTHEIEDKKECDEMVDIMSDILITVLCVPINLKKLRQENWLEGGVEKYIQEKKLYECSEFTAFESNSEVQQFFQFLDSKIIENEDQMNKKQKEAHKLYTYFAIRIMESLIVNKYNDLFWGYFKNIFAFLLESNIEDVSEQDILQKLAESQYPDNIAKDVLSIMSTKITSSNIKVRTKTLSFLRDFIFYDNYRQNIITIPEPIKTALIDENSNVQQLAIQSISDLMRIGNLKEIETIFNNYKQDAQIKLFNKKQQTANKEEYKKQLQKKTIGIYILMALISTNNDEIMSYTNEALEIILSNQYTTPKLKNAIQDFFTKFWTNNKNNLEDRYYNTSKYTISEQVIDQISNMSVNLSHYA